MMNWFQCNSNAWYLAHQLRGEKSPVLERATWQLSILEKIQNIHLCRHTLKEEAFLAQ